MGNIGLHENADKMGRDRKIKHFAKVKCDSTLFLCLEERIVRPGSRAHSSARPCPIEALSDARTARVRQTRRSSPPTSHTSASQSVRHSDADGLQSGRQRPLLTFSVPPRKKIHCNLWPPQDRENERGRVGKLENLRY